LNLVFAAHSNGVPAALGDEMKTRLCLVALAAIASTQSDVYGITAPSSSDGPIRLLGCVVTSGILEAVVDNQSEDPMDCNIRCNYELGERMFSHSFSVTIPARFNGRIGRFDTSNAKTGNYSGDVGTCKKASR
jgi:hypothetical protein